MATALGSSFNVSTWAKFRVVWCLQLNYDFESSQFSVEYKTGIKSASPGSGLIRYRPRSDFFGGDFQPSIWSQAFTESFPPPVTGDKMYADPVQLNTSSPSGYEAANVTDELRDELTGATVGFESGQTTTIPASFWQEGRYTWNPASPFNPSGGWVVSIEKFVAFT